MGSIPQLHTLAGHNHQEVLTVLTECQVMEVSMAIDQDLPPVGLMGFTGGSHTEDIMGTPPLQVTPPPASTQRRTSGSTPSTRTAAASSAQRS